jgi:hypothetical protein
MGREDDYGDIGVVDNSAPQELHPVDARHPQICDDYAYRLILKRRPRARAVANRERPMPVPSQNTADDTQDVGFIVRNEDLLWCAHLEKNSMI